MINRKELKQMARMRMKQAQPSYIKVMLLWVLAAVIIPQIVSVVASSPAAVSMGQFYQLIERGIDPETAMHTLQIPAVWITVSFVLSIVLAIYQGVLSFGLNVYCLDLYRGDPCGPSSLFAGFSFAGRVIGAQVLVFIFSFLWCMLLIIPFSVLLGVSIALQLGEGALIAVFVLLYILLFVGMFAIILRYALVNFALADDPELGALGAINRSKELMRGHKWELFKLEFSFIGWILLFYLIAVVVLMIVSVPLSFVFLSGDLTSMGLTSIPIFLTIFVALAPFYLWLTPYMNTTVAGFYEALAGGPAPDAQPWQPPFPPQ